jgi:hypothetical protein
MFTQSIKAAFAALRLLFRNLWALVLVVLLSGGLLFAGYLFVTTREATVWQLVLTLSLIFIAPVLFFALQAVSINYANGPGLKARFRKMAGDSVRLIVVTVPLVVVTALTFYGLGKLNSYSTVVVALRYLLAGVIAPLLAIQLWVAVSRDGLRSIVRSLRQVAMRAFTPQSVLVYGCGVLFFAVAPYLLIFHTMQIERAWLEVSFLVVRLALSGLLILLGWVTTVGTLSILARQQQR